MTFQQSRRSLILATTLIAACSLASARAQQVKDPAHEAAIRRAIAYLSVEVRDWSRNNGCFSCHNNGIGAAALFYAKEKGYDVPDDALVETIEWLKNPGIWDSNHGDPVVSDKQLARIHFAWARHAAAEADLIERGPVDGKVVEMLVSHQLADGPWIVDPKQSVGSPVTLGDLLATSLAMSVIADSPAHESSHDSAEKWIAQFNPKHSSDRGLKLFAAVLDWRIDELVRPIGAYPGAGPADSALINTVLDSLLKSQNSDGGWGPYQGAPSEIFDTSLALWGVRAAVESPFCRSLTCALAAERGIKYLLDAQLTAGGWPATTRPSGYDSYAQHIATTAWALTTLLLLNESERDSN